MGLKVVNGFNLAVGGDHAGNVLAGHLFGSYRHHSVAHSHPAGKNNYRCHADHNRACEPPFVAVLSLSRHLEKRNVFRSTASQNYANVKYNNPLLTSLLIDSDSSGEPPAVTARLWQLLVE